MTIEAQAKRIVADIVADIETRRGLRHEWDNIDSDIRREIKKAWVELVEDILRKGA